MHLERGSESRKLVKDAPKSPDINLVVVTGGTQATERTQTHMGKSAADRPEHSTLGNVCM